MDIHVFETADDSANAVADRVATIVRARAEVTLGLPAGRSPVGVYQRLQRMHAAGTLDFSRATAFTLDEFVGIPRHHSSSFHHFISEHFLAWANVSPTRVNTMNGVADDLDAECERYEEAITRAGGIGLQLLGIGGNGHIGFNEPGEALTARTHRVTLLESTRQDNRALFGGEVSQVPGEALTMGIGTILKAERILLIAAGERKADSVERMIRGPIRTQLPASLLQTHPRVEIYLDREAAARL